VLGERLAAARKAAKLTQNDVADQLGIRRQTYSAYERGVSTPDAHTIGILTKMFGVSADSLITAPSVTKHGTEYCTVPVYGSLRASAPLGREEDVVDYEEVDASLCGGTILGAIRIRDDRMSPRIVSGDAVIFRRGLNFNRAGEGEGRGLAIKGEGTSGIAVQQTLAQVMRIIGIGN